MRRILVLLPVAALMGAGCTLPDFLDPSESKFVPRSVGGLEALDVTQEWMANATTQDPDLGVRRDDGAWVHPNGTATNWTEHPVHVASSPFATQLEAIEGSADWAGVADMFRPNVSYVHPDYRDLVFHAIGGEFFPERFDDGDVDGVARHWVGQWQVEWAEGHQDPWAVEYIDSEYGGDVSWDRRSFAGASPTVCPDQATAAPAVDSADAVDAAMTHDAFAEVRQAHPVGQLWLRLTLQETPGYELGADGLTFVCPEAMDSAWRVRWMDLDATLAGGGPYVDVLVDARTGDVLQAHRAYMRPPAAYEWETVLSATDTMPGEPDGAAWPFEVPEDQVRLLVTVRPQDPVVVGTQQNDENDYRLLAPDGTVYPVWRFALSWTIDVVHPGAGTWQLERTPVDGFDTMHAFRNVTAQVVG